MPRNGIGSLVQDNGNYLLVEFEFFLSNGIRIDRNDISYELDYFTVEEFPTLQKDARPLALKFYSLQI